MVKFRVLAVLTTLLLMGAFATSSVAQEATRADFEEFCEMQKGRWVGDVIWTHDWPGMGKKGDKVTAYTQYRIEADGNALVARYFGGQGTGVGIYTYDAGKKQITYRGVSAGGTVWNNTYYKKDGKWINEVHGSNPDGAKLEGEYTLHISDNGKTHRWRGWGTVGGEKVDELKDVWHRVAK